MDNQSEFSILIVDDAKTNLHVLKYILAPEYAIHTAQSGKSALEQANEHKPDLILLDIILPDMSGFEVLAELKKSNQTCAIPVIFITGLGSVEDEEKGFLLGAVDYITKPFHNSIVKARVKTHLQIVKQIRTIERLGMIDTLTEIANRRSFDYQLGVEWNRAAREKIPISLLAVDVDRFKAYNDTYGHPQGDLLLQTLVYVFVSTLRRQSDVAARVGGEEFGIILPNTNLEGGLHVAENIRAKVEATKIKNINKSAPASVTVSIGVASMIPTVEDTISDFISRADKKLYEAKNMGRNRVCQ